MFDFSWCPVPGYEGFYAAARSGLVRSLDRTVTLTNGQTRRYRGRILKPHINQSKGGYPAVKLSRPGQDPENRVVHQVILETFVGECPDGLESLHGPLGPLVPALHNLCYGTRIENMGDKLRDGTDNRGENHPLHVLTASDVLQIRELCRQRVPQSRIAAQFGVKQPTVSMINLRLLWGWLEDS